MDIDMLKSRLGARDEHDGSFDEFLQDILNMNYVEGDKHVGITKLVIDQGINVLSDKQEYVFVYEVIKPNYVESCDRCAESIPWSEMLEAIESGYCGYCAHMMQKD